MSIPRNRNNTNLTKVTQPLPIFHFVSVNFVLNTMQIANSIILCSFVEYVAKCLFDVCHKPGRLFPLATWGTATKKKNWDQEAFFPLTSSLTGADRTASGQFQNGNTSLQKSAFHNCACEIVPNEELKKSVYGFMGWLSNFIEIIGIPNWTLRAWCLSAVCEQLVPTVHSAWLV